MSGLVAPVSRGWRHLRRRSAAAAGGVLLLALSFGAALADTWPTRGGEDGAVLTVMSLDDDGPGTLREALSTKGPRRIVFQVAGDIVLKKPLGIWEPSVTVAGETAPSPGITLLGDKVRVRTHDVVLRHLRIHVGEVGSSKPDNRDGISIEGADNDETPVGRILIENCSVLWAVDENLSMWGKGIHDVAVRKTIVAEALRNSVHPKGEHAMGLMVGPGSRNVLLEQNLIADNAWRNPVVHGGANAVVVNNLIYNPRFVALHFYRHERSGPTKVSAVGNVVIAGPNTRARLPAFAKGINPGSQVFYRNNLAEKVKAFDPAEEIPQEAGDVSAIVDSPPVWIDSVTALAADQVEAAVLADVGARPWDRDGVDRRIVEEVRTRTGGIKDRPGDPRLVAPRPLKDPKTAKSEDE